MPSDLPVRCACGELRGTLRGASARSGYHVVCYCDDCQAFARFLGGAERILDAHGGTDIFQVSPARLELAAGAERLACMRLRPGGLLRWYASCCRTPIGNTLATRQVPFVGLICACLDRAADGRSRDEVLGPVRARAFARFARGDPGPGAHPGAPWHVMLPPAWMVLRARLGGEHARTPFFDAASGAPRSRPKVLGPDELRALRA